MPLFLSILTVHFDCSSLIFDCKVMRYTTDGFSSLFFSRSDRCVHLLARNVSLSLSLSRFSRAPPLFSRKVDVLRVACTPATLSRTYMYNRYACSSKTSARARPTVTILKNTSSSPIVINRLGRGNARRHERGDFRFRRA